MKIVIHLEPSWFICSRNKLTMIQKKPVINFILQNAVFAKQWADALLLVKVRRCSEILIVARINYFFMRSNPLVAIRRFKI